MVQHIIMRPLLRSGFDRSDRGNDCPIERDRRDIAHQVTTHGSIVSAPGGAATVVRGRYPAFDGAVANGPHLRIGLCVGGPAKLAQQVDGTRLEGHWRSGSIVVTPPGGAGTSRCSPVDMIGLAIAPALLGGDHGLDLDGMAGLAGRFHDDALLAAVTTALHGEAEVHGASTAFFEHGVALLLARFAELWSLPARSTGYLPLSAGKLERVSCHVASRLGDDISVTEMAAVAGMDPSAFTRALRARTGLPPYAWLTRLRMERASDLLAEGWTVTQVATASGYANSGKFAAAFRRTIGRSPSEWQRRRLS